MSNYARYQEAVKTAQESEGTAQKKYEAQMESIEYHLAQLNTAWEKLTQTVLESDFFKGIIKSVTELIDNLPRFISLVLRLMALLQSYKAPAWLSLISKPFTKISNWAKTPKEEKGSVRGAIKGWLSKETVEYKEKSAQHIEDSEAGRLGLINQIKNLISGGKTLAQSINSLNTSIQQTNILTEAQEQLDLQTQQLTIQGQTYDLKDLALKDEQIILAKDGKALTIQDQGIKRQIIDELKKTNTKLDQSDTGAPTLEPGGKPPRLSGMQVAGMAITTGITSGISGAMQGNETTTDKIEWLSSGFGTTSAKVSDLSASAADRAVTGIASGVGAGLGSLLALTPLGPVGGMIGSMLGSYLGEGIATLIKHEMHLNELQRKDRIDAALKVIESIDATNEALSNISNKISSMASWDESDRAEMRDYIRSFKQSIFSDTSGVLARELTNQLKGSGFGDNLNEALDKMVTGTSEEAKQVYNLTQAVLYKRKAAEVLTSQEEDRYAAGVTDLEDIRKQAKKLGLSTAGDIEETLTKELDRLLNKEALTDADRKLLKSLQELIGKINASKASFEALNAEVNKTAITGAFYGSEVARWSASDIVNKSLEEAIFIITQQLIEDDSLYGKRARGVTGSINEEIRDYIVSTLKDVGGYERLFRNDAHALIKLMQTERKQEELVRKSGGTYDFKKLMDFLNTYGLQESKDAIRGAAEEYFGTKALTDKELEQYRSLLFAYNAMTEETKNFARALNVLPEDLKNFTELSRVSLGDLSKSVSDLAEDMDNLSGVINDIISTGGLSVKNLSNILNTMPQLLGVYEKNKKGEEVVAGVEASTENVIKNVFAMFYGGRYNTLLANATFNQIRETSGIMDMFKETLGGLGQDVTYLKQYETLTDAALNDIRSKGHIEYLIDFLKDIDPAGYMEVYLDTLEKVSSYQAHMIDNMIDNLQSQKDALGSVNEEYKKQIDLIKARQALENAQNEKKRVYRAGVGWTYEADQTAVAEAREALADKEREVEEENLQYQIDVLTKIKDIFEHIPDNMQLEQQKEYFTAFGNAVDKNIYTLGGFSEAINTAYNKTLDLGDAFGDTIERLTENKVVSSAVKGLLEGGSDSKINKAVEASETVKSKDKHTQEYYNAASTLASSVSEAKAAYEGTDVENWGQFISKDESGKQTFDTAAFRAKYGRGSLSDNNGTEMLKYYNDYRTLEEAESLIPKEAIIPSYKTGFYHNIVVYFDKDNEVYYKPTTKTEGLKDKDDSVFTIAGTRVVAGPKGEITLDQASAATRLISTLKGGVSFGDAVLINGKLFVAVDNKGDTTDSWRSVQPVTSSTLPFWEYLPNLVDNYYVEQYEEDYKDLLAYYDTAKAYASGTLSAPTSQISLINELGTEGIVTPRGTVTALPSHTGIVPADLTRNLYTLGELAPSLVKTFSLGQNVVSQKTQTSEDNSMNINNLYATFETDEGFDFERLLIQARQYVATTKNNRH